MERATAIGVHLHAPRDMVFAQHTAFFSAQSNTLLSCAHAEGVIEQADSQ